MLTGRAAQVPAKGLFSVFKGRRARKACSENAEPYRNCRTARRAPSYRRARAAGAGARAGADARRGGAEPAAGAAGLQAAARQRAALRRLLSDQDDDLQRADRHHRPGPARPARSGFGARGNPRHRQRDHLDQGGGDVHRGAGTPAPGHLQRRAGLRPARAAAGTRRHRRHHGQRRQPASSSKWRARCSSPTSASATTRS